MPTNTTMGVKLDSELRERLKALGTLKQRSVHWLMREAIREYIEREEVERKVSLSSSERRLWFLKWTPDWTFSYLKPVDEAEGKAEIQDLGFTGYVKF
jgi:hypothetical protein